MSENSLYEMDSDLECVTTEWKEKSNDLYCACVCMCVCV